MLEISAPVNKEIQTITHELVNIIDDQGWSIDPEIRQMQFELADAADQAYLDRDFDLLRNAATRLKNLLMAHLSAEPQRSGREQNDEASSLWPPAAVTSIPWGRGYEQTIAMLEAESQAKKPGKRRSLLNIYCEHFWHIPTVRVESPQITREEEKRKNSHLRLDKSSTCHNAECTGCWICAKSIICTDTKCPGCWACDCRIWPVSGEYDLCLDRLKMELELRHKLQKTKRIRKNKSTERVGGTESAQAL